MHPEGFQTTCASGILHETPIALIISDGLKKSSYRSTFFILRSEINGDVFVLMNCQRNGNAVTVR